MATIQEHDTADTVVVREGGDSSGGLIIAVIVILIVVLFLIFGVRLLPSRGNDGSEAPTPAHETENQTIDINTSDQNPPQYDAPSEGQ